MPRLQPLAPESTPELAPHFDFFLGTLGFTPNSVLTMQRKPRLVRALAQLNAAAMDPEGEVDLGFRRLIGHLASKASGCLYCQAHTLLGAKNFGVDDEKLAAIWDYAHSPLYSQKERLALDFALAAAAQPNAVTDAQFEELQQHWSDTQIVEILGVVALFGFLNRWNDTMATPLEAAPMQVAQEAAGARGFDAGKHGHGHGHGHPQTQAQSDAQTQAPPSAQAPGAASSTPSSAGGSLPGGWLEGTAAP